MDNFETIKADLRKATIKELSDCIKTINAEAIQHSRLLVSGKKDELVVRLARFVSNTITEGNLNTASVVVRVINETVPRKLSWTLNDGVIEVNSQLRIKKQIPAEEITFKYSPFFKPMTRIGNIKMCPASTNMRQSKSFQFTLSEEHRRLLAMPNIADDRPPYQLRFYCARYTGVYTDLVLEFPSVCELKVNDSIIQGNNLRCIKGKPGTVNPPDITVMTRKQAANSIDLVYINNDAPYIAAVYIVERTAVPQLIATMKETRVLSKEDVLEKLQQTQEDADIIMESETLRTKDPLAFTRITTPIRSKKCPHLQCFDANVFLTMNEQTPTWTCPVCNRRIESWEDLIVDEYFLEMLANTPKHIDTVRVEPNGHITIIDENPELANNDDDDDEEEEQEQPSSQVKLEEVDTILLDDDDDDRLSSQHSIPSNSTVNKRKRSEDVEEEAEVPVERQKKQKTNDNVIDLTLDSDDEEPSSSVPSTTSNAHTETLILPHLETIYSSNIPPTNPTNNSSEPAQINNYMNVYKYS